MKSYMRGDAHLNTSGVADLSPLLGVWHNVNPQTRYICRFEVALAEDSSFHVRFFGSSDGPEPIDWGQVPALPVVLGDSLMGIGFHTTYLLDGMDITLCANGSKGVTTVQTYATFTDGSGRPNYFTREFFHR